MKKFRSLVSVIAFCITPGVFGMHDEGRSLNDELIVERARHIMENVQVVDDSIKNVRTNPVVLLGATGSGKTSLLHVLVGTKMVADISDTDPVAVILGRCSLIPDEAAVDRVGRVAGGGESVTSDVRILSVGDVIYCDGPGFFDTNGGFTEMGNHLSMNEILKMGAKILWVVSASELAAKRGEAANGSLSYLLNLLPSDRSGEGERKARSVGMVISQGFEDVKAEIVLSLLREKDHHWLIDYWSEHAENVFWFPAPGRKGVYDPPQKLIDGITSFAERQSELITGSMGLQPNTIEDLIGKHGAFDVVEEVKWLVDKIDEKGEDLESLQELKESFDALWNSLAKETSNTEADRKNIVRRWRRRGSQNPRERFEFTLKQFVDELNNVEYFKDLCGVGEEGFGRRFDKGIVWERLVECLSLHSGTSEENIARLRNTGNNWKQQLSDFTQRNREVTQKIEKMEKQQRRRTIRKASSAVLGTVGALGGGIGGFVEGPAGSVAGVAAGGAGGVAVGAYIGKGISKAVDTFDDLKRRVRGNNQSE